MSSSVAAQIIEAMDAQRATFEADVVNGLSAQTKSLPSRWLYDDRGSDLFEQITKLPEYYPTRTETGILTRNAQSLAAFCGPQTVMIEYGAGASIKSQILLNALRQPRMYVAVDIAGDFLATAADRLRKRFTVLEVLPVAADFTQDFDLPDDVPIGFSRTGFFPGSTIGNLNQAEAISFLERVHGHVTDQKTAAPQTGRALIGIDLRKSTDVLIPAYDDAAGITAAFNLNVLRRINRELGGTFKLNQFRHEARWNDQESSIEMHIVSLADQTAIAAGMAFDFAKEETIHTESSRKYSVADFSEIAANAGWQISQTWTDDDHLFAVIGLETKEPTR